VRKPTRPDNDLPARLVTAAVLVPVACYVVSVGGLWLLGTVMTLVILGQREFYLLSAWRPRWRFAWSNMWEPIIRRIS